MSSLKVTRLVGHGSRPPQTFIQSPVKIGTASGSTLKFDSSWDKGVAERHAIVELTPRGWVWRDMAGTTLCNGVLMHEAKLIDGTVEFELSSGGVRLRLEGEAVESGMPAGVPSGQGAFAQAMPHPQQQRVPAAQMPLRQAAPASGSQTKTMVIIAAVFVVLILAAGAAGVVGWWMMSGSKKPKLAASQGQQAPVVVSNSQPPPSVPAPQPAPVSPPSSPAPAPAPAPAPVPAPGPAAPAVSGPSVPPLPTLTPVELTRLASAKGGAIHKALVEFWRESNSRSPYVKAALAYEDHWLIKQLPWLQGWNDSGGRDTGRGTLDFPGVFVPEAIYANAREMGVPSMPASMLPRVMIAVAEKAPAGANGGMIASRSDAESQSVLHTDDQISKVELMTRLSEYALPGNTQAAGDKAAPRAWALLIGINRFEGAPPPPEYSYNLSGCRNDVAAVGKVLMTQGIFEPERVRFMTDARKGSADYPSKANVIAALLDIVAKADVQDIVFVSFSTHGRFDKERNDSCLSMADGRELYGLDLQAMFLQIKAKNVVITMDACHTGGMDVIGATQSVLSEERAAKNAPIPESFYEKLGSSRGHVVIRACRADQTTPDIRSYGHGILTATMVSGLTGDADRDRDGIVTLSELRVYVTTAIPKITQRAIDLGSSPKGGPLQPTFTSSSFGEAGDLPLTVVPVEKK